MYAQKKPIDNAHIVRERDRQRFLELLAVLSLGIPIGLFLLLFTWQNLEVIRLGRDATRLQNERKVIEDSNKLLQLELDRLTAFSVVEKKAEALGFVRTDAKNIVTVRAVSPSAPSVPNDISPSSGLRPPSPRSPRGEGSRDSDSLEPSPLPRGENVAEGRMRGGR